MKRDIVKIDRDLCNGCGECVPNCHEGALQIVDDKAVLISDLMCDGLGACIGHCPVGAITIEQREAEPYNETKVMEDMVSKGKNTVIAHLKHLKDHNEMAFFNEGVNFLKANADSLSFDINDVLKEIQLEKQKTMEKSACGCPGSQEISFKNVKPITQEANQVGNVQSELQQWPVQLHLVSPMAGYFQEADVLIAADCTAFSVGDFHSKWLKGKALAIACPKLDSNMDVYQQKIIALIDQAKVNTITVMIMEVPCCGGLLQIVKSAAAQATRKVPIKAAIIGVRGNVIAEEWV